MTLKIGALFAGYGGLDMAVMDTLDAKLAWYAEFDKAPAKVMAHHHPNVPNLWDVTKVDWSAVEPVDIITGGSPCQDLSHAGKRKGMTDGTRSNLWAEMREAIATHRPRLVVWENVRGALSAHADSDMEPCPRCVGGADDGRTVLRALGRVLGDLAELGYDSRWYGLRAADVGGAHGRFREFVIAAPADAEHGAWGEGPRHGAGPGEAASTREAGGVSGRGVLRADRAAVQLFPTPRAGDGTKGGPNQRGSSGDLMLPSAVMALLPTPTVDDAGNITRDSGSFQSLTRTVGNQQDWRQYEAAIRRAEIATGRTAPTPTEAGPKGKPRLSPAFVEWLMMLPADHVTNPDIGLTRNEQLKALGNGVVPPQAAAALRAYLRDEQEAAA